MLDAFSTNCSDMAQSFTSIGFDAAAAQMNALASKLKALSSALSSLKEANDDSWAGIREQQTALIDQITSRARPSAISRQASAASFRRSCTRR